MCYGRTREQTRDGREWSEEVYVEDMKKDVRRHEEVSEGRWGRRIRYPLVFLFSNKRQHTRYWRDWSSDVCSSDLSISPGRPFPTRRATASTVARARTGRTSSTARARPRSPTRPPGRRRVRSRRATRAAVASFFSTRRARSTARTTSRRLGSAAARPPFTTQPPPSTCPSSAGAGTFQPPAPPRPLGLLSGK